MKILHVIPFFAPKFGGSVTALFQLSKNLALNGHENTILTSDFGFNNDYANDIKNYGVKVIPFHTIANVGLFIYTPSIKSWLRDNIKNFDVIHMHNFRSYQNNIVYFHAMRNNIPFIVQPQGSVLPFFEKKVLKRIYDVCWGNRILINASHHFASSIHEYHQIQSMGVLEKNITVVPTCIDNSEFNKLPPKRTFKMKYGIRDDEKVILYLGRIHEIKGIDLLMDAFVDLLNEMDNIKLVIIGPDGGLLNHLLKKVEEYHIQKKTIFTGMLSNSDKLAAYVDAEIYVLPSKYEAFGLTVLEAWACGTPAIISEGCLISEFLSNNKIIFKRNKYQLKELIKQILLDNEFRINIKQEGERLINNKFNWTKGIENYVQIYSTTLAKASVP